MEHAGTKPAALGNSAESLATLIPDGKLPRYRAWAMLALRPGSTLAMLLTAAALYASRGIEAPFDKAAAWWLWYVTAANALSIFLMARFGKREGLRLRDIYFAKRSTWKGDLPWFTLALAVTALVAQVPGMLLANLFWGTQSVANNMLFGAIPVPAIYPLFGLMPTSHAFAELPLYWGYVAPRLRAAGMNRWLAIAVVGSVLSLQHLCFSFQPDWRYALWLAVKFLPFALWTGFVVDRRPTVLPWMMGGHFLLDAMLPYLQLLVSRGLVL